MTSVPRPAAPSPAPATGVDANGERVRRIRSADLMHAARELEIEHAGRIYRLRITQLNKLILTA